MNTFQTAVQRAGIAWWKAHMHVGTAAQRQVWEVEEGERQARKILHAALDDAALGDRIRDWRLAPCEHSRPLRYGPVLGETEPRFEQACSPCLRDRMRAWLLDGAA